MEILSGTGYDLMNILVVLPNSRGATYLQNAFRNQANGKALLLPTMVSMDDLVRRLNPETIIAPAHAQLILFESFRSIRNPKESLSGFLPLAQVLLSDFEDIIRSERSPDDVFGELRRWTSTGEGFADFLDDEQKEILMRFSSLFQGKLTETRQRFVDLWASLPSVFSDFRKRLSNENLTTSALAYRFASSRISGNVWMERFDKVYFAGFGFLSKSEISIMRVLAGLGKAEFCWDLQPWYSDVVPHEVNRLFSPLKKNSLFSTSLSKWEKRATRKGNPVFTEITCKGLSGMAQWMNYSSPGKGAETAVLATDPGFVHALVMTHASPVFPYNVSMGFPLAYAPLNQWIQKILKWVSRQDSQSSLDLPWVLEDYFFKRFFPEASANWTAKKLEQHYFTIPELKFLLMEGPSWLWASDATDWVFGFNSWLEKIPEESLSQGLESLSRNRLLEVFRELADLAAKAGREDFGFQVIGHILPSLLYRHPIDIQGSVSEGIQVMGLYESRLLDFKRIIVAPGHEGNIPSQGNSQTFLPENIRKAFGLPLRNQRTDDEMYQFYRLTHRAEEIVFLLGNDPGQKRSRILDQIQYGNYFPFRQQTQEFGNAILLPKPIEVSKSENLRNDLARLYSESPMEKAAASLSPSSLHALLVCPLRFYYQKIARLEEPETFSDLEMNPMDFGNWIHSSIQFLLEEFGGHRKFISKEDYQKMIQAWDSRSHRIWATLDGKTSVGPLDSFEVEMEVGRVMALRFFHFMSNYRPHRWLENERPFPPRKLEEGVRHWDLSGRADVILETEEQFLILDLKTGGFKEKKEYLVKQGKGELLPESRILKNKDLFQMLLYNRMAADDPYFQGKPVRSALFFLADPHGALVDPFELLNSGEQEADVFISLNALVRTKLELLADPETPIRQTEDTARCQYCSFSAICQR